MSDSQGPLDEWMRAVPTEPPTITVSAVNHSPAYIAFPVECLPEPLRSLVNEGASSIGCDPAAIVLPALSALGGAVGTTRALALKSDWRESPIIWTLYVSPSGTRKTPAFKLALEPVLNADARFHAEFRHDLEQWEQEDVDVRGVRPVARRIYCQDITIEAVADVLRASPRGIVVGRDELSAWVGGLTRYRTTGSDMSQWLELHSGGTLSVDRKGRDRILIPHAAAAITGGIQPGILARAFTPEHRESGLAARFQVAMPPTQRLLWNEASVSTTTKTEYARCHEWLLGLDFAAGGQQPVIRTFAPTAKERWIAWFNEWQGRLVAVHDDMAARLSKLEAVGARLALLFQLIVEAHARQVGTKPIELDILNDALVVTEWFANEADRVERLLQANHMTTPEPLPERVWSCLAETKNGRMNRTALNQAFHGRVSANDLTAALNLLRQQGRATCTHEKTTGRPIEWWAAEKLKN